MSSKLSVLRVPSTLCTLPLTLCAHTAHVPAPVSPYVGVPGITTVAACLSRRYVNLVSKAGWRHDLIGCSCQRSAAWQQVGPGGMPGSGLRGVVQLRARADLRVGVHVSTLSTWRQGHVCAWATCCLNGGAAAGTRDVQRRGGAVAVTHRLLLTLPLCAFNVQRVLTALVNRSTMTSW